MKIPVALLAIALVGVVSCNKAKVTNTHMPVVAIPGGVDSVMGTYAASLNPVVWANYYGAFIANSQRVELKDSTGKLLSQLHRTVLMAQIDKYPDSANAASGSVTVNGAAIPFPYTTASREVYQMVDAGMLWSLNMSNQWVATNVANNPAITYGIPGDTPFYTDPLPVFISHTTDLLIPVINAGADSAFAILDVEGRYYYSNMVSGNSGTAVIKAAAMTNGMQNLFQGNNAGKAYYGVLDIVLVRRVPQTIGGRKYVFINMSENVRSIYVK